MSAFLQHSFSRPILAGAFGAFADRMFFNPNNMQSNLIFGGAIVVGSFFADVIGQYALPKSHYKTLETRALEVASAVAATYVTERYLLQYKRSNIYFPQRLLTIAAAEAGAGYVQGMLFNTGV